MVLAANLLASTSPLVASMALEMGAIVFIVISVVFCTALPLTTGISKGHVTLGIICALITLPFAAFFLCVGGLPVGIGLSVLIAIIPKVDGPLLSQSEIEAETRKLQGY